MELPQVDKNTSIAVLGLGKFGMSVARELCNNDFQVLCCDKNASLVHEISEIAPNAVQADIHDPAVLNGLGIGNYDMVIIAFSDDFESELLTTMIVKEMGVSFVLAKAAGLRQKKILESVGADLVIMPEIQMGQRVAQKLITNDPMEYIYRSADYEVVEMDAPKEWVGKNLEVLDLRANYSLNILALIRDEKVMPDLSATTVIEAHDKLLAVHMIR